MGKVAKRFSATLAIKIVGGTELVYVEGINGRILNYAGNLKYRSKLETLLLEASTSSLKRALSNTGFKILQSK